MKDAMNHIGPHCHGGDPRPEFDRLKIPPRPVIDFSVSVNPLGPPPVVKEAWGELFGCISRYPSTDGKGIKEFYAERYGIDPDEVFAGNGASEILFHLFRVFSPKLTVSFAPSYGDYARAALSSGSSLKEIPLPDETSLAFPPFEVMAEACGNADIVIMGNPNNPTGASIGRETILRLAGTHEKALVVVDESFMPFTGCAPELSLLTMRDRPGNIMTVQSLTKMYCLPGLRLGACIARGDRVRRMEKMANPWRVNAAAESVAPLLAGCTGYEQETVRFLDAEKKRLYGMLAAIPGVGFYRSDANFILAKWNRPRSLDDLLKALLARGIFVRDCRNFRGLEHNCFRFGVLRPRLNDFLIAALNASEIPR